jgi:type IV pilus assembly protein PilB
MAKVDTRRHIGGTLVERGIVTPEQLEKALKIQQKKGDESPRKLGQILHGEMHLDRHEVMRAIADVFAFPEIKLDQLPIPEKVIERVKRLTDKLPKDVVDGLKKIDALPYITNNNSLVIAASDPTDQNLPELASQLPFKHFEIAYCRLELVKEMIGRVFENKNEFLELLEDIEFEQAEIPLEEENAETVTEADLDAEINQSALNTLVEGMLIEAVHKGASDIHIIPYDFQTTDVLFRIDGKLQLWHRQTGIRPEAISAVVKDKTRNVDRFERDSSQDGFIQRNFDKQDIRYRVSIIPIVGHEFERKFESIVIRVLDDRKVITDLNKLGLQKAAYDKFLKAINKPSGIVIITGPTGSGKSTTLVAALYSVIDPSINVLTVEDPVEYIIKGARQLKINPRMTFDESIRGILRHDPDIVLVGEIRDLKTAEVAIKLANTGHLTFSTLHTNDAPSAVSRLYTMGVEPFLIANAVNLIMAQRLVRKLCNHCKREIENPDGQTLKALGFTDEEIEHTTFYEPVGCDHCTNGYKGRTTIMEALYFSKTIKNLILSSGDDIDEEKIKELAIAEGMLTLRVSGRERIKEGVTSIEEIMAITVDD